MVTFSSWCHSYLVVCVKVKLNMYILISQMVVLNIIMNRVIDHSCLTFKKNSSFSLLDMVFEEKQITLIAFFKIVIEIVLVGKVSCVFNWYPTLSQPTKSNTQMKEKV